jgi:hypothetical protein
MPPDEFTNAMRSRMTGPCWETASPNRRGPHAAHRIRGVAGRSANPVWSQMHGLPDRFPGRSEVTLDCTAQADANAAGLRETRDWRGQAAT